MWCLRSCLLDTDHEGGSIHGGLVLQHTQQGFQNYKKERCLRFLLAKRFLVPPRYWSKAKLYNNYSVLLGSLFPLSFLPETYRIHSDLFIFHSDASPPSEAGTFLFGGTCACQCMDAEINVNRERGWGRWGSSTSYIHMFLVNSFSIFSSCQPFDFSTDVPHLSAHYHSTPSAGPKVRYRRHPCTLQLPPKP